MSKPIDDDDLLFVHNDFVAPGLHNYFIIVSNGTDKFIHKAYFTAFVKPRSSEPEIRSLPLVE